MTDLKEGVEVLKDNPGSFWDVEFISPLIDMLVEEKAKYLHALWIITSPSNHDTWEWLHSTEIDKWRTQALRELNLEGVWPIGKEK